MPEHAPQPAQSDSLVIGGGVAGLATALALARQGCQVTLLERDLWVNELGGPEDAFALRRRGAPQLQHSHAFLARLRNLLRDRAPDVLQKLLGAGASEIRFCDRLPEEMQDREPRPGDDDLVALACRRTTFEWVLRRAVLDEPRIIWQPATSVEGLLSRSVAEGIVRIVGVRARGGDRSSWEIRAGLVIDASGRFSSLPSWLEDIGARRPQERSHECGIIYASRFYRLRTDVDEPGDDGRFGGDLGYMKYALFQGDNRTFSVTFGIPTDDPAMRPLLREESFHAAASALPVTGPWVDPRRAEPISDVAAMGRLANRRRRLVADDSPVATGIVAIGDAAIHTNPLYGRGCALAVVQAWALADLVAARGLSGDELSVAWAELLAAEVEPWYKASVAQDASDLARRRSLESVGGAEVTTGGAPGDLMRDAVLPATRVDPVVYRAFVRGLNILDSPTELIRDAEVVSRVLALWEQRKRSPQPPAEGPSRAEMLGLLASVGR